MNTSLFRFVTIASFLFINFFASASVDSESPLYKQLKDVNAEWNFYADLVPTMNVDFESDLDLIQFHLEQVVTNLRLKSSDSWTESQFKNRNELIDVLEGYADRKIFPTNLYHSTRTPYFIDDFGIHCAVGYLIAQSGNEDLALEISQKFNYNYIEDIESDEMIDWAEEFGFSLDELKWIQPAYPPIQPLNSVGNGTNGEVHKVYSTYFGGKIIIVGDFDSLDLQPCLNIGVYQNDQLSCLGGGLAGVVNNVHFTSDGTYVVGNMESNGATYPLALYDNTAWQFFAIPGREGATGTNIIQRSSTEMVVTIQHGSLNGDEEIWVYSSNSNLWELEARVNGVILDIEPTSIGSVYAGHFDSFTRYATVPYTIPVTNVIVKENNVDNWFGLGSEISDTVKAIETVGAGILFGGTCSNDPNESNICLTRYQNGSLQSLVLRDNFTGSGTTSINDIAYASGSVVMLGGNFEYVPLGGYYGKSLVSFDIITSHISGMGLLDNQVNSLDYRSNDLFIGGDFKSQFTNQPLNHLAKIESTIGLEEETIDIKAYPNPFQTTISIEGFDANSRYSLIDLSGKVLRQNEPLLDGNLDLSSLENGVYVLQIETELGIATQRIIKIK